MKPISTRSFNNQTSAAGVATFSSWQHFDLRQSWVLRQFKREKSLSISDEKKTGANGQPWITPFEVDWRPSAPVQGAEHHSDHRSCHVSSGEATDKTTIQLSAFNTAHISAFAPAPHAWQRASIKQAARPLWRFSFFSPPIQKQKVSDKNKRGHW